MLKIQDMRLSTAIGSVCGPQNLKGYQMSGGSWLVEKSRGWYIPHRPMLRQTSQCPSVFSVDVRVQGSLLSHSPRYMRRWREICLQKVKIQGSIFLSFQIYYRRRRRLTIRPSDPIVRRDVSGRTKHWHGNPGEVSPPPGSTLCLV